MFLILLFSVLFVVALTMVALADRSQKRQRHLRLSVGRSWQRIGLLEQAMECLEQMVPDYRVALAVNEEIQELLEAMPSALEGDRQTLANHLQRVRERGHELENASVHLQQVYYPQLDDAQAQRVVALLQLARRVLEQRHQREQLSDQALEEGRQAVAWTELMASCLALVDRGRAAHQKGNGLAAQSCYRRALGLVSRSKLPHSQRPQLEKQLQELVEGQRQTLSDELAPRR